MEWYEWLILALVAIVGGGSMAAYQCASFQSWYDGLVQCAHEEQKQRGREGKDV